MKQQVTPWSEVAIADVAWAHIEFVAGAEGLQIAAPSDPTVGLDRVLLARFGWPVDLLGPLATAAGCTKPFRRGRQAVGKPPEGAPDWWRPTGDDGQLMGTNALSESIARELVAIPEGPTAVVYLRAYEI